MVAYSLDLRTRVLKDSDAGMASKLVAETYAVSREWGDRLKQRRRETGEIAPRRQTRWRTPRLHAQLPRLAILIREHPDRTLVELQQALPTAASLPTIWRAVTKLGCRLKKTVHATEHARPDVAEARAAWQQTAPTWDPARLVCLDESGVRTDLVRRSGRGQRGERVVDHAPDSRWHTTPFLAALRVTGLTAPAVFDGPIDGVSFLAYIEHVLAPTLRPGDVVVLDNLSVHRSPAVRAAPFHWGDECDRREGVRQAWVRQLWKARPQHRGPRLVCDEVGPPPAVPLHSMRGNAQHEHGDRVPRSSLQSTGVRPGREPTSRGRQHFCDRPSDGPFPHHHRAMARASRDSCRVLQSPAAARFRRH